LETFENILIKSDWPLRSENSNISFQEIEKNAGFELPSDYKLFLQKFSGYNNFIGKEFVSLWGFDDIIEANNNYEIIKYLKNIIGIGTNGAGEFIGLEKISENKFRIVISPLIGLDEKDHINIGSSFSDFLMRLDNGQEWFD